MSRPETNWTFNYADLAEITGLSVNAVYQAACRNSFDPSDLHSVILWVFRAAGDDLKEELIGEMGWFRSKKKRRRRVALPR